MARDIEKVRAARRRWYERNKEKQLSRQRFRKQENRAWLTDLKASMGCSRCPETHSSCLEFHHVDSTSKAHNISSMVGTYGRNTILEEVKKCVLLCANCHRKEHDKGD